MTHHQAHVTQLISVHGSTWTIRPAEISDAEDLLAHLQRSTQGVLSNQPFSTQAMPTSVVEMADMIRTLRQSPIATLFVVVHDEQMIGAAFCHPSTLVFASYSVKLSITVDPAYQACGLHTQLVQIAIQWAKLQPIIRRMETQIVECNDSIVAFYERMGFVHEGRVIHGYPLLADQSHIFVDSILMALYI